MTTQILGIALIALCLVPSIVVIFAACVLSGRISQAEESLYFPDEDGDWLGG